MSKNNCCKTYSNGDEDTILTIFCELNSIKVKPLEYNQFQITVMLYYSGNNFFATSFTDDHW